MLRIPLPQIFVGLDPALCLALREAVLSSISFSRGPDFQNIDYLEVSCLFTLLFPYHSIPLTAISSLLSMSVPPSWMRTSPKCKLFMGWNFVCVIHSIVRAQPEDDPSYMLNKYLLSLTAFLIPIFLFKDHHENLFLGSFSLMLLLLCSKYCGQRDIRGSEKCHFQDWLIKIPMYDLFFSFAFH